MLSTFLNAMFKKAYPHFLLWCLPLYIYFSMPEMNLMQLKELKECSQFKKKKRYSRFGWLRRIYCKIFIFWEDKMKEDDFCFLFMPKFFPDILKIKKKKKRFLLFVMTLTSLTKLFFLFSRRTKTFIIK